jgi:RNase H-like domain found in reverse transcriptase
MDSFQSPLHQGNSQAQKSNYHVHERELLAIVCALEERRQYLNGFVIKRTIIHCLI